MSLLGEALAGQRRFAEAEPMVVQGYDGMSTRAARMPYEARALLAEAAASVVRLYDAWGKPATAAEWKARLRLPDLPADVFAPPGP